MKVLINERMGGFGFSSAFVIWLVNNGYADVLQVETLAEARFEEEDFTEDTQYDDVFAYEYNSGIVYASLSGLVYSFDEYDDSARSNPRLIEAIEKFGAKNASSHYASLKVVEIPDDVDWYIYRHDQGHEIINENHRTWS